MNVSAHALASFSLLAVVLMVAGVLDLRTGKVHNWLTYPAIAAGFLLHAGFGLAYGGLPGLADGVIASGAGFLLGFVPFLVLFALIGTGGGDVKLMGAVGAIAANAWVVIATAAYGLLLCWLAAVVVMISTGRVRTTIARILAAAVTTAAREKPEIQDADSPRIAIAAGLAVGGIVAGLEHILHAPMPW